MNRQTADGAIRSRRTNDVFRVSLSAEVKVRSDRVLKKLNQKITGEEEGGRAYYPFRDTGSGAVAPQRDALRDDLNKDRGEHEAGTESHEIFKKLCFVPVSTRGNNQETADEIREGGECPQ